jgi:hypothetical protein
VIDPGARQQLGAGVVAEAAGQLGDEHAAVDVHVAPRRPRRGIELGQRHRQRRGIGEPRPGRRRQGVEEALLDRRRHDPSCVRPARSVSSTAGRRTMPFPTLYRVPRTG